MAKHSPESSFDPNESTLKLTKAQRERFVPIEQVPDGRPDPAQALMAKEEEEKKPPEAPAEKPDENDLSRPMEFKLTENKENGPGLEKPGTDSDQETDAEIIASAEEKFDKQAGQEVAETAFRKDLQTGMLESHGKRGRIPRRKNRPHSSPDQIRA